MRRLMRLFCRVTGHDWAPPVPVRASRDPLFTLYRTECRRCDVSIAGDWDWIEANHAWEHYR